MRQPAEPLAARYHLRLAEHWQAWFDGELENIRLPGSFRVALSAEQLLADYPQPIWPGFMLPDSLPLISNDYGDWICARVGADGNFGELIHWYHGGGDWIPLGSELAEMVVHDVVDQFRPIGRQMLRGAPESIEPAHCTRVLSDFARPELQQWLAARLTQNSTRSTPLLSPDITAQLDGLTACLAERDYPASLQRLRQHQWASDAVACDLIQLAVQQPIGPLADSSISQKLSMAWTPDYVRWLFDVSCVPEEARPAILALVDQHVPAWPQQNWELAEAMAQEVLSRRLDLGWAVNMGGWCRQRAGDIQGAIDIYFAGRFASAFSDQAVRMRTHWSDARYGKFTMAQLSVLAPQLSATQRDDDYLTAITQAAPHRTMGAVCEHWLRLARQQLASDMPAEAYSCFYRAGWDMGLERLSDYQPILEGLITSAQAAGWAARAAVAQTHLSCLRQRLTRKREVGRE
jgi:hypothetical protein